MREFKAKVRSTHERKSLIAGLTALPSGGMQSTFDVYEGSKTSLPVVRIPIDLPVYRMANARTQTEQLAYISERAQPSDFFSSGQDNSSAQQAQHEILSRYAKAGTDSIKPISDELERTKQTEPLLLSPSGVVINGNRRLAAMRDLYFERPTEFPTFAEVECMILPQLTEEQIDDIETRLQERPETRLPYSWINETLKIRRQLRTKKEAEVADIRRRTVGDIRKSLGALNYAEIYLKDWRLKPNDYRLVEKGEQFFSDLVPRLKGKGGPLLEANLKMAWLLFDNRDNLGSRIYNFNRVIGDKAEQVLAHLAERLELEPEEVLETQIAIDLGLDIDLGAQNSTNAYSPLVALLDDSERREEVFDELRAVCQTIIDSGQATRIGKSALRAAQDANTRLTEIDLTTAERNTHDAISKQLVEIVRRATTLLEKLVAIERGAETPSS